MPYKRSFMLMAMCVVTAAIAGCAGQPVLQADNGILVDSHHRTVYTFDKDEADSGKSACYGPCATAWPHVTPEAEKIDGSYSVIMRDDGSDQLTYKGKPLYFYARDDMPGQRNGDNFKGIWHVVTP